MASEIAADQMQVSEADKQTDITKLDELVVEGLKKLDAKDLESAVELLSEAATLADSVYDTFAPEVYNVFMQYGRALVALASDEISKLRVKGEFKASNDDENEQPEETKLETIGEENSGGAEVTDAVNKDVVDLTLDPEDNADGGEVTNVVNKDVIDLTLDLEENAGGGEVTDAVNNDVIDLTLDPEENAGGGEVINVVNKDVVDMALDPVENAEEELDEIEEILSDAWDVLEVAKQTCVKQLQVVKEDVDVRQWKLKMSEPLYFLGHILILNGKPEEAKAEFTASLEIKRQLLDADDRTLAANYHSIGESFAEWCRYADAKAYLEKALEALNKKIMSLEVTKEDKNASAEIEELRGICKEVQFKIADVIESEKSVLNFRGNVRDVLQPLTSVDPSSFNDVSHSIKRRKVDLGDKQVPTEELVKRPLADDNESDAIDAKKSKPE